MKYLKLIDNSYVKPQDEDWNIVYYNEESEKVEIQKGVEYRWFKTIIDEDNIYDMIHGGGEEGYRINLASKRYNGYATINGFRCNNDLVMYNNYGVYIPLDSSEYVINADYGYDEGYDAPIIELKDPSKYYGEYLVEFKDFKGYDLGGGSTTYFYYTIYAQQISKNFLDDITYLIKGGFPWVTDEIVIPKSITRIQSLNNSSDLENLTFEDTSTINYLEDRTIELGEWYDKLPSAKNDYRYYDTIAFNSTHRDDYLIKDSITIKEGTTCIYNYYNDELSYTETFKVKDMYIPHSVKMIIGCFGRIEHSGYMTIHYDGTYAEWRRIINNNTGTDTWQGLVEGTYRYGETHTYEFKVDCTDAIVSYLALPAFMMFNGGEENAIQYK